MAELVRGLSSNPKFIPYWYLYDAKGEELFVDVCEKNKNYYLPRHEKRLMQECISDLIGIIPKPFVCADIGCGDAKKSLFITDEYLKEETSMTFVPIDVCDDVLHNVREDMEKVYGHKIDVAPISGLFEISLPQLFFSYPSERKLLVCFSSMQNLSYDHQLRFLSLLSGGMKSKDDFLMLSLDITKDKDAIEKAYLDQEGFRQRFFYQCLQRINTEFNAGIVPENFVLECEYKPNSGSDIPGGASVCFRSKYKQVINIEKLELTVEVDKDEKVMLSGGGQIYSYKYNEEQMRAMFQKSNLQVVKIWKNEHCTIALLQKP